MANTVCKIDEYKLGARILELRNTLTCEEIADTVNRYYLPAGASPINKMTVSRYCTSHGLTDMQRNDITKNMTRFDSLKEACAIRDRVIKRINKTEKRLDRLKDDEEKLSELASAENSHLNYLKALMDFNSEISRIQKEQLGLDKVRRILSIILDTLRKYPQVKAEVYKKFQDSDLMETIRSV